MNCQEFRDSAIEFAASPALLDSSVLGHADSCAECAAIWQRMQQQAGALGRLQRIPVPAELEGRVVASAQAGFREDRAVRHLRALPNVDAPSELERRVAELLTPMRAPDVLERLVAEDQDDPARALARRFTRKLGRRLAPADLDTRMTRGIDARYRSLSWRAGLGVVAGLVLAVWFGLQSFNEPTTRHYDFEIREMASADELSPFAKQMVGGLLGGALEARAR